LEPQYFGRSRKKIKFLKKELEVCRRSAISLEKVAREGVLRFKLERAEEQVDVYWRQRAHVKWLEKGDKNTSFFHAACSERRKHNNIGRLRRDDGSWVEGEEEKKNFVANHFFQLFRSQGSHDTDRLLSKVDTKVTGAMNELLMKEYTVQELRAALEGIGDLKAPGPDGMPAIFYKKFWEIVGEKVPHEVLQVLRGGPMPPGWNETTIVLIPKVPNPDQVKDLRPISLCNVLYKIVSKVLSNRLKQVLPEVISPSQSAFVPGRLISDNILIAYEMTHYMQKKKKRKEGCAAIKLDMIKAYDRVEWSFLQAMMLKLGFSQGWVELVMRCVTSVSYKIRVNGQMTEAFQPERGLRQGDPLSPYLFLLCAEGFSALLEKAELEGELKGIKICHGAPSVSHLLLPDDSLILCRADGNGAQRLQSILQIYEECSGQVINKEKSAVLFSPNTTAVKRGEVMQALDIQRETRSERYLGLPVYVGRSRTRVFGYLKERIWSRIQGWKERMLSRAGKEVMIKAVAQAIPTFAMGGFDLTKEMCDQISTMIGRYWWSQQEKENKMHWISWDKLTLPKSNGGLGFRDIHAFNLSMLAKQSWRLIRDPGSLCARILRAKYYPHGDILKARKSGSLSYTWRSIMKGVQVLKDGVIWRVGNGEKINIWNDP
jgi:hypothetical protein